MKVKEWPNGMGWDVGPHEVFKFKGCDIAVRTFLKGEPYKCAIVRGTDDLEVAVLATLDRGVLIDGEGINQKVPTIEVESCPTPS